MKITSCDEIKRIAEETRIAEAKAAEKIKKEKVQKSKEYRESLINQALEILEQTTDDILKEMAKKGEKSCRLQPLPSYQLFGLLKDDKFTLFITLLKKAGYGVKIVEDTHICRSSDPCWDGYESYTAHIEVTI